MILHRGLLTLVFLMANILLNFTCIQAQSKPAYDLKNSIGLGINSPFLFSKNPYGNSNGIRFALLSYSRKIGAFYFIPSIYYGSNLFNRVSRLRVKGVGVEIQKKLNISDSRFSLLLNTGGFYMIYDQSNYSGDLFFSTGSSKNLGVNLGVGIEYRISKKLSATSFLSPYLGRTLISNRFGNTNWGFIKLPSLELQYEF
jgi:hypothetical protein